MDQKIIDAIEKDIRPFLQRDGGDIEFVSFTDGIVSVRLKGACAHCQHAIMTLQMGVEARLKEIFPEVKSVERVK